MKTISKTCPKCKENKELNSDNFYSSKQTKSGYKCYCKVCIDLQNKSYDSLNKDKLHARILKSRNRNVDSKAKHVKSSALWRENNKEIYKNGILKRKYGITFSEFKEKFELQEGKCKICLKKLELLDKNTHVDHCHKTNKVRGILCNSCNVALGHVKDDITILKNAILYLETNEIVELI